MINAKLFVDEGAPAHSSGGDVSEPSHVYFLGISPISLNAGEVSVNDVEEGLSCFFSSFAMEVGSRKVATRSSASAPPPANFVHPFAMKKVSRRYGESPCRSAIGR